MAEVFRAPVFLFLLLLLPLVGAVYLRSNRARKKRLSALGVSTPPARSRFRFFAILVLLLLVVGIARPFNGKESFPVARPRAGMMLAVDISQSMMVTDVAPDRLSFTKRKILDLIDVVKQRVPGLRVGITLFAGAAYVYCPPTEDYTLLEVFVRSIDPRLISSPGSALQEALLLAGRSLEAGKFTSRSIVLMSDGEDHYINIEKALTLLKDSAVPLLSLGIGTPEGGPVPIPGAGSRYYKDGRGNTVISRLSEDSLSALASDSGGLFVKATLNDGDLLQISKFLEVHHQSTLYSKDGGEKTEITIYHELGSWFAFAALSLLLIATYRRDERAALWSLVLLLRIAVPEKILAQEQPVPDVREAFEAYLQGNYELARAGFKAELSENSSSFKNTMRLAAAEYRLGNFDEAASLYARAESLSKSGRELFEASYNKGNALLGKKAFDEAIKSYERALTIKPGDTAADFNLDLAKKLKELKPPKSEQEQSKDQNEKSEDENKESENQKQQDQKDKSDQEQKDKDQDSEPSEDKNNSDKQKENQKQQRDDKKDQQGSPDSDSEDKSSNQKPEDQDQQDDKESGKDGEEKEPEMDNQKPQEEPEKEDESEANGNGEGEQNENQELSEQDADHARAWLNSLPDDPLIIRQFRGRGSQKGGQLW